MPDCIDAPLVFQQPFDLWPVNIKAAKTVGGFAEVWLEDHKVTLADQSLGVPSGRFNYIVSRGVGFAKANQETTFLIPMQQDATEVTLYADVRGSEYSLALAPNGPSNFTLSQKGFSKQ